MLNCKEFVEQQNQRLDGAEFSILAQFSLKMHAIICHHCRRYLKQLKLVDNLGHAIPEESVDEEIIKSNLSHLNHHAHANDINDENNSSDKAK